MLEHSSGVCWSNSELVIVFKGIINSQWKCSSLVTIFTNDVIIYSSSSSVPFFPLLRSCFLSLFVLDLS